MTGRVIRLGRMDYESAWKLQVLAHQQVIEGSSECLFLVEHDPVITLGASFHEENLLLPRNAYAEQGIQIVSTDRGGDVTFHGPGQLTIYPIFDLNKRDRDVHLWLRDLEQTQIEVLAEFGLEGVRFPPHTGAWCQGVKVAAIGVKIRKWVSLHGIALNCDLPLTPFSLITPCGIHDHGVGSLSSLTSRRIGVDEAIPATIRAFSSVFGVELRETALDEVFPKER